jgi:arylsulfatase A-like enzyme
LPYNFGFEFFYGALFSNDMIPYRIYRNDKVEIKAPADQDVLTKRFTEEALAFIETHKTEPFFLYYAQPFPHTPLHASGAFRGKSAAGLYGDAVQEVDWSVGEIVKALEHHGIFDNTLFIFTSDNGPWHEGNPGYQRGRKYLPFEGGTRVPMIACWPAKIPAGTTCDAACTNMDLFPTFLKMLGLPLPADRAIDGKDISGLLADPRGASPHDAIYYFVRKQIQAIRKGKWKYHVRHGSDNAAYSLLKPGPFLFDMEGDPTESYNQAMNHPQVAEELSSDVKRMQASLKKNLRGWLRSNGK